MESVLEGVLEQDSERLDTSAVAFMHGAIDESGGIGTIAASRSGAFTYEQQVSILAALIAEVEARSDRAAQDLFEDLVTERNAMRSAGGDGQ